MKKESNWLFLTPEDVGKISKFMREHKLCQRQDDRFVFSWTFSGIGTGMDIECNVCKKKEDITNYDRW